jgi:hypothetical protein
MHQSMQITEVNECFYLLKEKTSKVHLNLKDEKNMYMCKCFHIKQTCSEGVHIPTLVNPTNTPFYLFLPKILTHMVHATILQVHLMMKRPCKRVAAPA